MAREQSPWLSIGRGGWAMHYRPYSEGTLNYGEGTRSHYGETWREHMDEIAPDALGTDTTAIENTEDLVTFAVAGPMGSTALAPGTVSHFFGDTERWLDEPREGRDPRFGSAGSLDYVALDVYAELVRRFGGRVFDPHNS